MKSSGFYVDPFLSTHKTFNNKKSDYLLKIIAFPSDPPGARTQDPNIKSVVLYLLS